MSCYFSSAARWCDSRFVDFTAPQSGSSVQFVTVVVVVVVNAKVIMGICVRSCARGDAQLHSLTCRFHIVASEHYL